MNLKDSGIKVVVGLYEGSRSASKATSDGLEVLSVAEASERADWIMILLPDEFQKDVYSKEIAPHLKAGKILSFAHGFNIRFELIKPPEFVDVVMIAPKDLVTLSDGSIKMVKGFLLYLLLSKMPQARQENLRWHMQKVLAEHALGF